jgi:hypothetical protein
VRIGKYIIAIVGALTVALLASCGGAGGGGATQMASLLPAGDYNGIVGFKPAEIYNSGIFKKLTEESGNPQAQMMKGQVENTFSELELKPAEIASMVMFMPTNMRDAVNCLDAPTTIQKIMDAQKANKNAEFEESEKEGTKIYTSSYDGLSMMEFKGLKLFGTKEGLESIIAAKKKLVEDEAYIKAKDLVDAGASVHVGYWGDTSGAIGMFGAMLGQIEGGDEAAETLQKLNAIGISVYLRDDIEAKIKLGFGEGADVAKLANFFNTQKTTLAAMGAGPMSMMSRGGGPDPEKIKAIAEKISFNAAGSVLEISVKLSFDDIMSLLPKPQAPEEQPQSEEQPQEPGEAEGGAGY